MEYLLWAAALLTFPFYVFSKGSMQLSSFIMVVLFVVVVMRGSRGAGLQLPNGGRRMMLFAGAFVVYCVAVNFVWAIVLSDPQPLVIPSYYLFDVLVLGTVLLLYAEHGIGFLRYTRWVLLASVLLQFTLSFFFAKLGFRERLFFANANQLGYYALVCASVFALPLPGEKSQMKQMAFLAGILMCMWLSVLSLSKAATLSTVIFLVLSAGRRPLQLVVGTLVVAALMLGEADLVAPRLENLTYRFATLGVDGSGGDDDSLEGRGYDRIWENPEMLVLGAGEVANYRWESFSKTGEIHSTVGTIVFSYGVPGMLIAIGFFSSMLRPAMWIMLPFALPELFYSLTHMSLRFVMTWVYFAILFCVGLEVAKQRLRTEAELRMPRLHDSPRGLLR